MRAPFFEMRNGYRTEKQAEYRVLRKGISNQVFLLISANMKQNYKFRRKIAFPTDTNLRGTAVRVLYHR
jgi:hypothetical protein